ncbi:MAG: hypothetical protein ACYC1U_09055 [Candidatus Aquicultorales bacterium]
MCTTGINTADYKLALHQQEELAKHLSKSLKQWADLAGMVGQSELGEEIGVAVAKADELAHAIHHAAHELDHVHDDRDHGVTISS